jgi:hypothetical protein
MERFFLQAPSLAISLRQTGGRIAAGQAGRQRGQHRSAQKSGDFLA